MDGDASALCRAPRNLDAACGAVAGGRAATAAGRCDPGARWRPPWESSPAGGGGGDRNGFHPAGERIRALAASGSPIVFAGRPVDDPERRCPDITLATGLLGWTPQVTLDEGLARTLEWCRRNRAFRDQRSATNEGFVAQGGIRPLNILSESRTER
jgi:hypothetical protein